MLQNLRPVLQPFNVRIATDTAAMEDGWRGSSSARGYDSRWRRFRLAFLRVNPLCADCKTVDRVTIATDVHHIEKVRDNRKRLLDPANCMALCHGCHSVRTGRGE